MVVGDSCMISWMKGVYPYNLIIIIPSHIESMKFHKASYNLKYVSYQSLDQWWSWLTKLNLEETKVSLSAFTLPYHGSSYQPSYVVGSPKLIKLRYLMMQFDVAQFILGLEDPRNELRSSIWSQENSFDFWLFEVSNQNKSSRQR